MCVVPSGGALSIQALIDSQNNELHCIENSRLADLEEQLRDAQQASIRLNNELKASTASVDQLKVELKRVQSKSMEHEMTLKERNSQISSLETTRDDLNKHVEQVMSWCVCVCVCLCVCLCVHVCLCVDWRLEELQQTAKVF